MKKVSATAAFDDILGNLATVKGESYVRQMVAFLNAMQICVMGCDLAEASEDEGLHKFARAASEEMLGSLLESWGIQGAAVAEFRASARTLTRAARGVIEAANGNT